MGVEQKAEESAPRSTRARDEGGVCSPMPEGRVENDQPQLLRFLENAASALDAAEIAGKLFRAGSGGCRRLGHHQQVLSPNCNRVPARTNGDPRSVGRS